LVTSYILTRFCDVEPSTRLDFKSNLGIPYVQKKKKIPNDF